jgi:nifR3 family TIM-barrel protein
MLHIGTLKIENWTIMAPMAGITNSPFRLIVKRCGAGLVTTEMISAMGLILGQKRTFQYLKHHPKEGPLAIQIFGSDPEIMSSAAVIAVEAGATTVDINMGCPARKIVKTGAGGALLRDLQKIKKILLAVRRVCSVPLTVKLRTGWSPGQVAACDVARLAEDCGVDALTIHPRFVTDGFSGNADWSVISSIKELVEIPVIGNGDIFKPSDALRMKKETGCDAVMIARGAVGNPWIFNQIATIEQGGTEQKPDITERKRVIMEHFFLLSDHMEENRAALAMRGLLLSYTKGLPHSSRFRNAITQIKNIEDLTYILDQYFSILEKIPFESQDS